ncbi:MAG: biotin transporter BioY [Eubacteriales bacterium]|nr:biotin transporter BioY [Sarcina sp.]MBR2728666.1 biotin transporter BioY [Lachnospiraceae bacterium]MDO4417905.1 biotin transporter BioY [Eubacteriales bacterium]
MQSRLDTRSLVLCALCAALTCILAPISIPLAAGVPISLATFTVMLSGVLLGARLGAVSQLIYVLLAAAGLPVLAGWTGGIGVITGMTGGYIVGYILLAFLTGLIYKPFSHSTNMGQRLGFMTLGMVVGTIALYTLGTAWFMFVTGMTLQASLAACVLPFLPGDICKMIAVLIVAPQIEAAIRRAAPSDAFSA